MYIVQCNGLFTWFFAKFLRNFYEIFTKFLRNFCENFAIFLQIFCKIVANRLFTWFFAKFLQFATILQKICKNFAKVWQKFHKNFIKIAQKFCKNFVRILRKTTRRVRKVVVPKYINVCHIKFHTYLELYLTFNQMSTQSVVCFHICVIFTFLTPDI